jgi:hypothetical protein
MPSTWASRGPTPELYQQKCTTIFEHFYVSYPERDASVYAGSVVQP